MGRGHKHHVLMERLSDNLWSSLIQRTAHLSIRLNLALPKLLHFQTAMMKISLIRRLTIDWDPTHREVTAVITIGLSHDLASF